MDNMTYKQWIEWHTEDIKWIINMAFEGIRVTPDAENHPANVLLHGFDYDVTAALQNRNSREVDE